MTYRGSARHGLPEAAVIDALIARHGIVRVPTYLFEYGGYRYTNVDDAVAEAKRRTPTVESCQEPPADLGITWEPGGEA
jgi:hypothetical protein